MIQVYDQLTQNILLQTSNETDSFEAQLPRQRSSVGQIFFHLETLEETSVLSEPVFFKMTRLVTYKKI